MTVRDQIGDRLVQVLGEGIDVHRCLAARALGRIGQTDAVAALVHALHDEDEDVRADAAVALGQLGDPASGDRLLENLLGDPSPEVKGAALDALVRMRHGEIVPWLMRLVRGKDPDIVWDESDFYESGWDDWADFQSKSIAALGALRITDAVPDIVDAMNDEFGQDLTEVAFPALARMGSAGIDALTRFMESDDGRTRRRAAAALAASKEPLAQEAVVRVLADVSPDVRLAAARVLASRDPADARLAPLFSDPADTVRAEIVRLCGKAHAGKLPPLFDDPAPDVINAVFVLLAETPGLLPDDEIAFQARRALVGSAPADAAALALAIATPEEAVDLLAGIIADRSRPDAARCDAIRAMPNCQGPQLVPSLTAAASDTVREIRLEAMTALLTLARAEEGNMPPGEAGQILLSMIAGTLTPEPETPEESGAENSGVPVQTVTPPGPVGIEDSARVADPAGVEDQVPHEDNPAQAIPVSTLDAILGTGEPESADAVLADEEQVELSEADVEFLRLSGQGPVKRRIALVTEIPIPDDMRRFAARLLGDLDQDDVVQALAAALDDRDEEVCAIAANSLAQMAQRRTDLPAEVLSRLRRAVAAGPRDVRLASMQALGAAGDKSAAALIRKLLGDTNNFLRGGAVDALSCLGETTTEVAALLADPDPGVRLAAARAVASASEPDAIDNLVNFAFAFEGHHCRDAARLLYGLDADAASVLFLRVLDDSDRRRIWQIAIEALEELNPPDPLPRLAA